MEHGQPMDIIGTGGLAQLFSQDENIFNVVDRELTTHGLFVIDKFNRKLTNE
jgi:type III pantothenate kinase